LIESCSLPHSTPEGFASGTQDSRNLIVQSRHSSAQALKELRSNRVKDL
jgi:hypothetical protein